MIKILDKGYVDLIEHWGSDERIVESARMSSGKGFISWDNYCKHCRKPWNEIEDVYCANEGGHKSYNDKKFLAYLWKNKHLSPFEQAGVTVEVKAPIFIARQWMRHRNLSYNEWSARYSELEDEFYTPSLYRLINGAQSSINKQSSGGMLEEDLATLFQFQIEDSNEISFRNYKFLLEKGLSRELARLVLPVNMYTKFRASGNLRNWLHFCELRNGNGAQYEISEYSKIITYLLKDKFPKTIELFEGE